MRLQSRSAKDATHGAFAYLDADRRKVLRQERRGPVSHGYADILRWPTGLGDYARAVGFRERECGRPVRGASASIATGSACRKRRTHRSAVRS